jgi:copper transport protein
VRAELCPVGRRAALLAVLTGLVVALLAVTANAPAAAHAQLLSTDPADGTILSSPPAEVMLTFNEPVRLVEDAVRVLDPAGSEVDITTRAVDEQVLAALPAEVPDGTYVVSWRVVSADSHPIAGAFTFSVGAASDTSAEVAADEEDDGVTVATIVAQAAAYLGLLTAAGLVVFQVVLLPGTLRGSAQTRRLHRLTLGGAVLAVVALLVALPLADARESGDGLSALADPGAWTGQLTADPGLTAGLAAAGLAAGLTVSRWRPAPRPGWAGLALAGAGVAVGALALVGHTRTYGPGWLVVSSDLLHVVCGAVWFGGLIGLWAVLRDADPVGGAVVVSRFSTAAAALVAALSIAGVLLGWRVVGSWSALFGTTYGVALLVKGGLAAAVVAVAGYNRYRLLPRLARTPSWPVLHRTVGVEASVIVVILALTGFLVEQNPRGEPSAAPPPAAVTAEGDLGADGHVDLTLTPDARGDNVLELHLTDAAGAPLVPHHPPMVRLTQPATELGPFEHAVTETGPGSYEATVDIPLSGEWIVEVVVRVSEFDEPIARLPVEVG